jgi:predicted  nucleic acid-binding Zn-ribbon protein
MKLYVPVRFEIDNGDDVKAFDIQLKRTTKKDDKKFKKWAKEQEKKYEANRQNNKHLIDLMNRSEYISEEISDVGLLIDATLKKGNDITSLVEQRMKLRDEYKVLQEQIEDEKQKAKDIEKDAQDLYESIAMKLFEIKIADSDAKEQLKAYIDELGVGYQDVVSELKELEQKAIKKK